MGTSDVERLMGTSDVGLPGVELKGVPGKDA